jgi:hypothetical protein
MTKEPKPLGAACLEDSLTIVGIHDFEDTIRELARDFHFATSIPVPLLGEVALTGAASAELTRARSGTIGPVSLDGICFYVDPLGHRYGGSGRLHIEAVLGIQLQVRGNFDGRAHLHLPLEVAQASGNLSGTVIGVGELHYVSPVALQWDREGVPRLTSGPSGIDANLDLQAMLDGTLSLSALSMSIYRGAWHLINWHWGRHWPLAYTLRSAAGGASASGAQTIASEQGLSVLLQQPQFHVGALLGAALSSAQFAPAHGQAPPPNVAAGQAPGHGSTVALNDPCTDDRVQTWVDFHAQGGGGKEVVAQPLTRCPGNTKGSDPAKGAYLPGWQCVTAAKQNTLWVHAHLLHGRDKREDLHGPGDEKLNLMIADKSVNIHMYLDAESYAIRLVNQQGWVLWYDAKAAPVASEGCVADFAETITVSFGPYDLDTHVRSPAILTQQWNRQRPIPEACVTGECK